MKKILILILLVVIGLLGVGCSNSASNKTVDKGVAYSIVDARGNKLDFKEPPQRVYLGHESLEEIALDIISPERFAGVSKAITTPGHSLALEKANRVKVKLPPRPSVEGIIALKPDLVILQDNAQATFINTLKDSGLKVMITKGPSDIPAIKKRIILVAEALGDKNKGLELVKEMERKQAYVDEKLKDLPKQKVVMAYSVHGVFGSPQALFHKLCTAAHVTNGAALAGIKKNEHLSKEQIIKYSPDYFLFALPGTDTTGNVNQLIEEVMTDPALQNVKAVANRSMIRIHERYRYAGSQYAADAIVKIAEATYPEYFKNK